MPRVEARRAAAAPADPAPVFAALGDATRLALVARLIDGKARSITQLTDGLSLTRQAITKHLRVLEQAGLVSSIQVGRESRFAFRPEPIEAARSYLGAVSMHWDNASGRLKRFVEGKPGQARQPRRRRAAGSG